MQYLVSVIDDQTNSGNPDEMAAINVFNDRLEAEGHWVFAGGLEAPNSRGDDLKCTIWFP